MVFEKKEYDARPYCVERNRIEVLPVSDPCNIYYSATSGFSYQLNVKSRTGSADIAIDPSNPNRLMAAT